MFDLPSEIWSNCGQQRPNMNKKMPKWIVNLVKFQVIIAIDNRKQMQRHRVNGNVAMAEWYEGRMTAFLFCARALARQWTAAALFEK